LTNQAWWRIMNSHEHAGIRVSWIVRPNQRVSLSVPDMFIYVAFF